MFMVLSTYLDEHVMISYGFVVMAAENAMHLVECVVMAAGNAMESQGFVKMAKIEFPKGFVTSPPSLLPREAATRRRRTANRSS